MRFITALFITCGLFSYYNIAMAQEPANLDIVKQEVIKYHDSGEYDRDLTKVTSKAEQYLQARLKHTTPKQKLAMVLDIDDTSISNYQHLVELNFNRASENLTKIMNQSDDPAIPETLKLYNFAKANHVAVFFITGRADDFKAVTEKNLNAAGFSNWDGLYTRQNGKNYPSIAVFKREIRKMLADKGYDIVINMGDQKSDLAGGYADANFKLPNPYYYIP